MKKKCVNCGESKPVMQFNFKNKAKGKRNARCKACTRKDIMAAYYKNKDYYLKYRAKHNRKILRERQEFLWSYLISHPCVDCGMDDPIVLQFDHVRGKKKKAVSQMLYQSRYPMSAVLEEIKKCDVRCANCHARKTAKQLGYYAKIGKSEKRLPKTQKV